MIVLIKSALNNIFAHSCDILLLYLLMHMIPLFTLLYFSIPVQLFYVQFIVKSDLHFRLHAQPKYYTIIFAGGQEILNFF